jgi:hypothetical protein
VCVESTRRAKAERAAKRAGENELKRKFREDLERREKKVRGGGVTPG